MRLFDADALLATLLYKRPFDDDKGIGRPEFRAFVDGCVQLLDAAPTLRCDTCRHKGAVAYADTPNATSSCNLDARWYESGYGCSLWEAK